MAVAAFLSLLALLVLQATAQQVKYFQIGGNLTLNPNHPEPITSITWKHKGNIIAEHIKGVVDLEYLGDFKGRAELDKTTGKLTIRNLRKSDDGKFTVEINNIVLPVQFDAVGINPLPSVLVIVRPLTCNSDAHNCTLSCGDNFEDSGPVQYFWKKGETGAWEEDQKTFTIFNEEEKNLGLRSFKCRAKNKLNQQESNLAVNPFHKKSETNSGVVVGVVFGVIIIIGAIVGGGLFIKKKYIKKDVQAGQGNRDKVNGDKNEASSMLETGKDSNSPV